MGWLWPSALWLLPLAGLPILLLLRRPPLERRVVSSQRLWSPVTRHVGARALRAAWRIDAVTVVRVALLLALVGALARPVAWRSARETVFVVGLSPTMATRQGAGTRLDETRRRAATVAAGMPDGAIVRLISAGSRARNIGGFDARGTELTRALGMLTVGAARADVTGALDLARRLAPGGRVWVFSDAARPDGAPSSAEWIVVGTPMPNVAVTAFDALRDPDGSDEVEVVATIANLGPGERRLTLSLDLDGRPLPGVTRQLSPGGEHTVVRRVSVHDGIVRARVTADEDALASDDERLAVVPAVRLPRVRLVSAGNPFLERALAANRSIALTTAATRDADASSVDVLVCDGCATAPPNVRAVLLIPAPLPQRRTPEAVALAQPAHPLALGLDVGSLSAATATTLTTSADDAGVVLRAGHAALLTVREQNGQRVVTLNADLRSPAWPRTAAFPIVVANALRWLSGADERPRVLVAGTPLRWRLREAPRTPPTLTGPGGRAVPARVERDVLLAATLETPGIYTIQDGDTVERLAVQPLAGDEDADWDYPSNERVPHAGDAPTTVANAAAPSLTGPNADGRSTAAHEATWLLLLAALALGAGEWHLSPPIGGRAAGLRLSAGTVLLLALVNRPLPTGAAATTAVFALDRSTSLTPSAQQTALARVSTATRSRRAGDQAGLVVFAEAAAVDRAPAERALVGEPGVTLAGSDTNIEAALRVSRSLLSGDGLRRIVLVSDGRETVGDAVAEATRAAADGVRVDVMVADAGAPLVHAVRAVRAPADVHAGEPFPVWIVAEGPAHTRARVVVDRQGDGPVTHDIDIGADGLGRLTLTESRTEPGLYTFRAALAATAKAGSLGDGDDIPHDAGPPAGAVVAVTGPRTVLYVTPHGGGGAVAALAAAGVHVVLSAPAELRTADAAFRDYDAVVLDDVRPDAIGRASTAALARYVEREGGGLLLLGGLDSLGTPGYIDGPLGAVLPVDLSPRPDHRRPASAFIVVFDKSGSMADRENGIAKIELAREAVVRALTALPPGEAAGVIAFDTRPVPVVALARSRDPAAIGAALRRIEPAGATAIAPAVELAAQWLRDAPVERRHVLLVSDGHTTAADLGRLDAATRNGAFTLSVVAIGPDANREALRALAVASGGQAYFPEDLRRLPEIAVRDAVGSRGGSRVDAHFTVRMATHPALAGLSTARLPALDGYVGSTLKPGSAGLLTSHLDDPILAVGRAGLGRVGVYTADLRSDWSAGLRRWPRHDMLWAQTVGWLARRSTDAAVQVDLRESGDSLDVTVEAERGGPAAVDVATVEATVRDPIGEVRQLHLRPTAPGRFSGRVRAARPGVYRLLVSATDAAGGDHQVLRGAIVAAERERLAGGPNPVLLARLAALTGGTVLPPGVSPYDMPRPMGYASRRAWFVGGAGLLWLAGLFVRPRPVSSRRRA